MDPEGGNASRGKDFRDFEAKTLFRPEALEMVRPGSGSGTGAAPV